MNKLTFQNIKLNTGLILTIITSIFPIKIGGSVTIQKHSLLSCVTVPKHVMKQFGKNASNSKQTTKNPRWRLLLSDLGLGTKNKESADQIYARFVVMSDITACGLDISPIHGTPLKSTD